MHNRSFFRKFGRPIALVVVLCFVSVGVYLLSDRFFSIQNIEIEGQGIDVVLDERTLPKNLLFFPSMAVRVAIMRNNPLLATLEFHKKFPHTLVVVARPRKGIARLVAPSITVIVDSDGVVLSIDDPYNTYPVIEIDAVAPGIGSAVGDGRVVAALGFLHGVERFVQIARITMNDSASLRARMGKTDIIIPQNGDMHIVSATLQTLLSGFRIRGTMPSRIDLRFDKPVVTF